MKLAFSQQIFEKCSKYQISWKNLTSGSQVPCGRTDKPAANSRVSRFCESAQIVLRSVFKFGNLQWCQSVGELDRVHCPVAAADKIHRVSHCAFRNNSQCSPSRPACPVRSFCLDGNRRAAGKTPNLIELFFFQLYDCFMTNFVDG